MFNCLFVVQLPMISQNPQEIKKIIIWKFKQVEEMKIKFVEIFHFYILNKTFDLYLAIMEKDKKVEKSLWLKE